MTPEASIICDLLRTYDLRHYVETGANTNGLTAEVLEHNRVVYAHTIEWSWDRWRVGLERMRPWSSRCRVGWGESGAGAGDTLITAHRPALFWLDAHVFDEEEMATGEPKPGNVLLKEPTEWDRKLLPLRNGDGTLELTPILRELRAIGNQALKVESVVVIPHVDRYETWPGYPPLDILLRVLSDWFPRHRIQRQGNTLRATP